MPDFRIEKGGLTHFEMGHMFVLKSGEGKYAVGDPHPGDLSVDNYYTKTPWTHEIEIGARCKEKRSFFAHSCMDLQFVVPGGVTTAAAAQNPHSLTNAQKKAYAEKHFPSHVSADIKFDGTINNITNINDGRGTHMNEGYDCRFTCDTGMIHAQEVKGAVPELNAMNKYDIPNSEVDPFGNTTVATMSVPKTYGYVFIESMDRRLWADGSSPRVYDYTERNLYTSQNFNDHPTNPSLNDATINTPDPQGQITLAGRNAFGILRKAGDYANLIKQYGNAFNAATVGYSFRKLPPLTDEWVRLAFPFQPRIYTDVVGISPCCNQVTYEEGLENNINIAANKFVRTNNNFEFFQAGISSYTPNNAKQGPFPTGTANNGRSNVGFYYIDSAGGYGEHVIGFSSGVGASDYTASQGTTLRVEFFYGGLGVFTGSYQDSTHSPNSEVGAPVHNTTNNNSSLRVPMPTTNNISKFEVTLEQADATFDLGYSNKASSTVFRPKVTANSHTFVQDFPLNLGGARSIRFKSLNNNSDELIFITGIKVYEVGAQDTTVTKWDSYHPLENPRFNIGARMSIIQQSIREPTFPYPYKCTFESGLPYYTTDGNLPDLSRDRRIEPDLRTSNNNRATHPIYSGFGNPCAFQGVGKDGHDPHYHSDFTRGHKMVYSGEYDSGCAGAVNVIINDDFNVAPNVLKGDHKPLFVYSAWYKEKNGQTLVWGMQVEKHNDFKDFLSMGPNGNADDFLYWREENLPYYHPFSGSTIKDVIPYAQKQIYKNSIYAGCLVGYTGYFNSGVNPSGDISGSPHNWIGERPGDVNRRMIFPAGKKITNTTGFQLDGYSYERTGLRGLLDISKGSEIYAVNVGDYAYENPYSGPQRVPSAFPVVDLKAVYLGLEEIIGWEDYTYDDPGYDLGGGNSTFIEKIELQGNQLKYSALPTQLNIFTLVQTATFDLPYFKDLFVWRCYDANNIVPFQLQMTGAFPALPSTLEVFNMGGNKLELTATDFDKIIFDDAGQVSFKNSARNNMANFKLYGPKNNLGTVLTSFPSGLEAFDMNRNTYLSTVPLGWDPQRCFDFNLAGCPLTAQSKKNIIDGFYARRVRLTTSLANPGGWVSESDPTDAVIQVLIDAPFGSTLSQNNQTNPEIRNGYRYVMTPRKKGKRTVTDGARIGTYRVVKQINMAANGNSSNETLNLADISPFDEISYGTKVTELQSKGFTVTVN